MDRMRVIHFKDIEDDAKRIGIIPFNNNNFLMTRIEYKDGLMYGDFGGGCKKNESSVKSLFREIREEGGKDFISNISFRDLYYNSIVIKYQSTDHAEYMIFLPVSSKIKNYFKQTKEVKYVEWININKLHNIIHLQHIPIIKFLRFIVNHKYLIYNTFHTHNDKMNSISDVVINTSLIRDIKLPIDIKFIVDMNPDVIYYIDKTDEIMKIVFMKKRKKPYLKYHKTDNQTLIELAINSNKDNILYM